MYNVEIQDTGEAFCSLPGQSMLDAALGAGIDYPHACKSGTCGECKTLLIAGDVEQKKVSSVVLTDEERDANLFLACMSSPRDHSVVIPCHREESADRQTINGTISSIDRITANVVILRVRPDQPVIFKAGQFAHLIFSGHPPREYSFANAPNNEECEFHIRRVQGGRVSSHAYDAARPGDRVSIFGPFGSAHLRPETSGPLLLVASGTGLAPIKSILLAASSVGYQAPVQLYLGARDEQSLYLHDEMREVCAQLPNAALYPVVKYASSAAPVIPGTLDAALLAQYAYVPGTTAYLCGSPATVNSCRKVLLEKGVRRDSCFCDAFLMRGSSVAVTSA